MPVKIGTFGPLSEAEFTELRQQKARKTDPAMAALLAEIATGQPVRVPLVEGQSARGLRTAISRAATSRGMTVETVEGDGFVAVRKADEPRTRKGKQASRGRAATAGPATQAPGAGRRRDRLVAGSGCWGELEYLRLPLPGIASRHWPSDPGHPPPRATSVPTTISTFPIIVLVRISVGSMV